MRNLTAFVLHGTCRSSLQYLGLPINHYRHLGLPISHHRRVWFGQPILKLSLGVKSDAAKTRTGTAQRFESKTRLAMGVPAHAEWDAASARAPGIGESCGESATHHVRIVASA